MRSNRIFTFCFLAILLFSVELKAQNLLDKISKIEKAIFSITSYGNSDSKNITSTGFFISPNGIGIAPANVFSRGDSILLTLRNGRKYHISRILSTNKMANLAMFKTSDHRQKGFDYIIPSQNTERSLPEVLILSNPNETEDGISLGTISKVYQAPYLDRLVIIEANYGEKSSGAPVINSQGQFIGIAGFLNNKEKRYFLSTHILNDSLWINHPYNNWRKSIYTDHKNLLSPYMSKGILNFVCSNWVESAKNFTLAIKNDSTNTEAFIFRGEARRQYENFIGMRSDFEQAKKLSPNHFLIRYFEAKDHLKKQEADKAFLSYLGCIESQQNFSPALIEFGLLAIDLRNDIETAMECYNKAIQSTPLYADGYYERSRLLQQYFNDDKLAMEDITKAIDLNSRLPGAYSIRGTLKIQTEDYLDAINDFDKALIINPGDTHALFNRGVAYYNIGMKNKSCQDWESAGLLGHYKSIKYISRYCNNIISK